MFYRFTRNLIGASLFFLYGCAELPRDQLVAYLSVSKEATTSGEIIYGALNAVTIWGKSRNTIATSQKCSPSQSSPACFDPAFYLPDPGITDPDIEVRVLALQTVAAYNDILVALNSGQTGAALNRRIQQYGTLSSNLFAATSISTGGLTSILAAPVLAAIGGFSDELETARARFTVRQSVLDQSGTIKALIDALIADTSEVYQLYRAGQLNFARTRPGGPSGAKGAAEFAKIKAMHESLGAYVVLLVNSSKSLDILTDAIRTENTDSTTLQAAIDQTLELKLAARSLRDTVKGLQN